MNKQPSSKKIMRWLLEGILSEQEPQLPAPEAPPASPVADVPQTTMPSAETTMGVDNDPITVDSIIARMNVIRGGKSFADPEVYGQLTTYFKQMREEEKITFDKILADIGKVVINVPAPEVDSELTSGQPAQTMQPQQQQKPTAAPQTTPPVNPPAPAPVTAV